MKTKNNIPLARRGPGIYIPGQEVIRLMSLPRPFVLPIKKRKTVRPPSVIQQGEHPVLEVHPEALVNGNLIHRAKILTHGDIITIHGEEFVYVDSAGKNLAAIQAEIQPRLKEYRMQQQAVSTPSKADPPPRQQTVVTKKKEPLQRVVLKKDTIIGRNPEQSGDSTLVPLDHPQLSRSHARMSVKDGRVWIKDLKSRTGTFVNGKRIQKPVELKPNDTVGIGPFSMPVSQPEKGPPEVDIHTRSGNTDVVARNLTRIVGKNIKILNNVSLCIKPKRFVCLLGPSGGGKTTLLNALSAREPATSGEVYVGGVNLYRDFEMLKSEISLVPQHDQAYEMLTPREILKYTANLRLPGDTGHKEIKTRVEEALFSVELTQRKNDDKNKPGKANKQEIAGTQIKRLSGGQKKRVSLANETVCRPTLLFLDEVTSGLDEETDWKIMQLCKQMADDGITVICVTHTLVNVEAFCDQLVVLARPGFLVFSGSPKDALSFFQVDKLGDIYRLLKKTETELGDPVLNAKQWQKKYENSPYYAPVPNVNNGDPSLDPPHKKEKTSKQAKAEWRECLRQFFILSGRNIRLLSRDMRTLGIALTQSILIAVLLVLAFDNIDAQKQFSLLFLLGISAFWLGCNNASKEIVKERSIYIRERDVNLSVTAYLFSKAWVFGLLVLLQALGLTLIVQYFREVPGNNLVQMILVANASICGTALGLLISAGCSTQDQANTVVPLALVPQIILGGAIVPVLPEAGEKIAKICISQYWIYEGLKDTLGEFKLMDVLVPLGIQTAHMTAFILLAFLIMFFRDRRG